ncbi:MAG TPA: transglycosylase SLT domain-containing protein [archaeon]|nr:transglycosylase SLT domain-containing protein [archaeon]
MDLINLPGNDPLRLESKALETRLRQLKNYTNRETEDENLRKVSRELESIFIKQLMDTMQKTVPKEGITGDSPGMETWRDLFNQKLAEKISEENSIGLAGMIYRQLSKDLDRHREVPPAEAEFNPIKKVFGPVSPKGNSETGSDKPAEIENSGESDRGLSSFKELIEKNSARYSLDPALVAAVVMQESGGNPRAVSRAGAQGLMQLMPQTADSLGIGDVFDPEQNIEGGTRYLRNLLDQFEGDEILALAAYNAGPTAVQRYNGVPPYPETQGYVEKVTALKGLFSHFSQKKEDI